MRQIALLSILLSFALSACHEGVESGESEFSESAKADDSETSLDQDMAEWQELVAFFQGSDGFGFRYIGDGSDLDFDNDYCSAAYAQEAASDSWAIDSSFRAEETSLENYLVQKLAWSLRVARAVNYQQDTGSLEEQDLNYRVDRLRRILIRAALRADRIEIFSESDRFGGYQCVEIRTELGSFIVASGGWS